MKSSKEDLQKRGMIEQTDLSRFASFSKEQLIQSINAKSPTERTAAVRLLKQRNFFHEEPCITALFERLLIEKALYTKLEICNTLEKGDCNTAKIMTGYLGKIGSNQHKALPEAVSKKKSYPLPRDIIARTLGNMTAAVFPILLEVLDSNDKRQIYEVIDAIGFLVFYHQELATASNLKHIIKILESFPEDEIILWKTILCASAFPLQDTISVLEHIKQSQSNQLILDEAERSLKLIALRKRIPKSIFPLV